MSSRLTSESRIYADKARDLNRQVSFIQLMHEIHENHPANLFAMQEVAICLVHIHASEATFVLLMKLFSKRKLLIKCDFSLYGASQYAILQHKFNLTL
jgi:hypothetical protein